MELEEIRGAVARGWGDPKNEKKIMDPDLAEAISLEIRKLFMELYGDRILILDDDIDPDYEAAKDAHESKAERPK